MHYRILEDDKVREECTEWEWPDLWEEWCCLKHSWSDLRLQRSTDGVEWTTVIIRG